MNGKTDIIQNKNGAQILFSDFVKNHITTHNKVGVGSVFSKSVKWQDFVQKINQLNISGDGGVYTFDTPNAGYNLVLPIEDAKKLPGAQETTVKKQEGKNEVQVPAIQTTAPLNQFTTNKVNVIIRKSNPQYLPDDVKNNPQVQTAIQNGTSYSVLTAFPGDPNIPRASEWNGRYAVIIPSSNAAKPLFENVGGNQFRLKKSTILNEVFPECCNTFRLSEGILPDDWEAKADKNRDEREKTDKEIVMDDGDFLKIWWYKSIPEIEGAIKRFERSKEINIAGMRAMRRNSMFLQIYKRFDLQAKSKLKYLNGILKSKKTDPNFVPDHYKEAVLEIRSTIDARSLSKKLKDYKAKVDSLGLGAFKELKHHPDVIYYKKLLKMKKDFIDKSLGEPIQSKEDIQKLYAALTKKYPNIQIGIDQDSEGNPIIDVDSGETTFYIVQKPNGRFAINAVWSGDETGRKNLDAASMIKSLDSIPGMKDSMNESMSDSEILKSQLANEQEFLKNDYDRYMECMNNKPLKDRKTPQEIRDGLILYWHVYRHIVDKED